MYFASKSYWILNSQLSSSSELIHGLLCIHWLCGFSSKKSRGKMNWYLLHAQSLINVWKDSNKLDSTFAILSSISIMIKVPQKVSKESKTLNYASVFNCIPPKISPTWELPKGSNTNFPIQKYPHPCKHVKMNVIRYQTTINLTSEYTFNFRFWK